VRLFIRSQRPSSFPYGICPRRLADFNVAGSPAKDLRAIAK
jgi:hypothetical protein